MERCRNCDSWKLETLGIGIERVEQEIRKLFPDLKLFRLDKESVKSEKRALEIVNKFQESPGSVLLGTELSLFYLKKPIENVAIASIDSLFALPDFRINEKIFYTLLTLRSRAEKVFIIQTRNADETVFDYALKGSLADFYREEIEDRKKFLYPPYSVFIKLSIEGKKPAILEDAQTLAKLLDEYNPNIYPSFSPSRRGNTIMNVILKLQSESWPDDKLMKKIMSLPPQVAVRVDPESLI
jgi:primosomal protein N' (replication factor Y)